MTARWLAGLLAVSALPAASIPSVDEIVKRSVANIQADWKAAPRYNFTERDLSGNGTKTYRVVMIEGSPFNKLIATNGKPLTQAGAAQEERKLRDEIAKRHNETPAERRKRIADYDRERHQDNALLEEMIKAFDFRLIGEETVGGRRCFLLESSPKPGYQPISRDTKVLTGMRGKMWVDERQYQWVKVQAEVFRPVAFGMFIAHVQPGTQFTLEQQPVQENLWLPSHFSVRVNAKVMLWSRNSTSDETYWNYSPASQDQNAVTASRH